MKARSLFSLLLIVPIVAGIFASAPESPAAAAPNPPAAPQPAPNLAITGITDIVMQGSGWVAEQPSKLKTFRHYAWGTKVKALAAGYQWFHLPMPYISVLDASSMYMTKVEFCAQSSNGASTKPAQLAVWENEAMIGSWTVAWANNNNYQCTWKDFTPTWYEGVGISVQIYFASAADYVTLYKGWVRVQP